MTTSDEIATRLKKGDKILLKGEGDEIFVVKSVAISAPGKHGHAKCRIAYSNLATGSGGEMTISGHEKIEKPVIEKERAQVISITPGITSPDPKIPAQPAVVQLMNLETFETYDLPVPEEINESELQAGVELDIKYFGNRKWIDRIVPT